MSFSPFIRQVLTPLKLCSYMLILDLRLLVFVHAPNQREILIWLDFVPMSFKCGSSNIIKFILLICGGHYPFAPRDTHMRHLGFLRLLPVPPLICLASMAFRSWRRGGYLSLSARGFHSLGFRVKVWWGGAQVMVAASSQINSPRI
jgi:hypothetical protein